MHYGIEAIVCSITVDIGLLFLLVNAIFLDIYSGWIWRMNYACSNVLWSYLAHFKS